MRVSKREERIGATALRDLGGDDASAR